MEGAGGTSSVEVRVSAPLECTVYDMSPVNVCTYGVLHVECISWHGVLVRTCDSYKGAVFIIPIITSFRAIGDVSLQPYVTCHPEILEKEIGPEDEYLVLASDGLWVRDFPPFLSSFLSLLLSSSLSAFLPLLLPPVPPLLLPFFLSLLLSCLICECIQAEASFCLKWSIR